MRALLGLVADVVRFSWVDGPGNRFVVFLQGCNLDCLACHNPQTIAATSVHAREVTVPELVEEVRPLARFLSGVTASGGEATQQSEFVEAFFSTLAADDELAALTRFVDTNGAAPPRVWDRLLPITDGFMVDLKALDPDVHRRVTGSDNQAVLESIRRLAAADRLYEVRLLLVPEVNDDDETLAETARWLTAVDPHVRVVAIGFQPHGARAEARTWRAADDADRARYRELLSQSGITRLEVV